MITLTNVSKYYETAQGSQIVLHNASCRISKNQHLGILADTRSGKSTVVRMLAGVEDVDEGSITKEGAVSWPIGFAGGFHSDLTGEENIRMIAALHRLEPDEMCLYCADMSELGDDFFQPVRNYSSGMRAALGFALSMAMDFDVYLADESVGVGNEAFRRKCEVILDARIQDRTFILFSRNIRLLKRFCTDAAVLKDGKIVTCDSFDEAAKLLVA